MSNISPREFQEFVDRQTWINSTSYQEFAPHEYTLRHKINGSDEEFDDVVVDTEPICNQVENYAKSHGISLEQGWKVKLATMVKREILKGTDKVVSEKDAEFDRIVELFEKL